MESQGHLGFYQHRVVHAAGFCYHKGKRGGAAGLLEAINAAELPALNDLALHAGTETLEQLRARLGLPKAPHPFAE